MERILRAALERAWLDGWETRYAHDCEPAHRLPASLEEARDKFIERELPELLEHFDPSEN